MKSPETGRCYMIGLDASEIEWVRLLVKLLRHGDPLPRELARQALHYVQNVANAASPVAGMCPAAER